MRTPTDLLKDEHQAIKKMLSVMDNVCMRLRSGENFPLSDLDKIITFLRVFADKCHHGKEEDLLFPAMEEVGIPREGGPIGVMLAEHEMGREYVRRMMDAVKRFRNGDEDALSDFIDSAEGYIQLLEQHIYKEDNILYPIADQQLSTEKITELLEEFEDVEEKVIGKGVHEEMHEILKYLAGKYLT
jgi:hemerythrin-like domain-containing protein